MLFDLLSGGIGGDLIYATGLMPKGGARFSRHCLISVLFSRLSFNFHDTRVVLKTYQAM